MPPGRLVPLFDFDGTLVDSDAALLAPFDELGVAPPPLGLPLQEACELVGLTVDAYTVRYDVTAAQPFPGVAEMLAGLDRWGLCSNKLGEAGRLELARLGWEPVAALFSEDFALGPKRLAPLLSVMDLDADEVVFVGDTEHDRACARAVGARFALAGWNARTVAEPGDLVLVQPADLLDVLR